MHILLVDDHQDTLVLFSRILRHLGHEAQTCPTFADGARSLRRGNVDLLISDLALPDGDGWSLANIAKMRGIKAIALTGKGMPEDILRSQQAGFDVHLLKPVDVAKLKAVITNLFSKAQAS